MQQFFEVLFGGIALVCVAIVLDALAYRKISSDVKVSKKGIVVSLLGGLGMGLFYPFVAKAISGENHLGPYTVAFVFALGIIASTIPFNYIFMRRPVSGPPVVTTPTAGEPVWPPHAMTTRAPMRTRATADCKGWRQAADQHHVVGQVADHGREVQAGAPGPVQELRPVPAGRRRLVRHDPLRRAGPPRGDARLR